MFKAAVKDAKAWRNILSAISPLVEEAGFEATPDGLRLRAMDPSHVAMVDFEWGKAAFTEYECQEPVRLRLNIGDMVKKLRGAGSEPLEMAYDDKTKKLNVVVKGKWKTTLVLPTLDPGSEEVPVPKMSFNAKIKMLSSTLRDVVDQAQMVSDRVNLEATSDKLVAEAVTELSGVKIELEKGSEVMLAMEVKETSTATFNLNYLSEIAKAGAAVSEVVTIEFSKNMPIKIEYEMSGQGRIAYYVAPRIEPA
jgi:proliferating cell nuclear antigen